MCLIKLCVTEIKISLTQHIYWNYQYIVIIWCRRLGLGVCLCLQFLNVNCHISDGPIRTGFIMMSIEFVLCMHLYIFGENLFTEKVKKQKYRIEFNKWKVTGFHLSDARISLTHTHAHSYDDLNSKFLGRILSISLSISVGSNNK